MVPVPPGCGSLSGTLVPAGQLDDHSNDAVPIGVVNGAPYLTNQTAGMITVGTAFNDHIQGSAGVDDTICGLAGGDHLLGGAGDDTIFGSQGADVISGDAGADDLHGGDGTDAIYGDNRTNSNGGFDGADLIVGGAQADTLRGGAGYDDIRGGGSAGIDFAESQADSAKCTGIEDVDTTAAVNPPADPLAC